MFRLLVFFLVVAVIAAGAVWLSDQQGSLTLDWQGYEIRITILGAVIVTVIGFSVLYGVLRFIGTVMRAPANAAKSMRIRRRERGLEALSRGLIAVSSGHVKLADKLSAKAHKLMPREPLTLLLQAQAAQLKGDANLAGQVYRTMLEEETTQTLGLLGLFNEARRVGDNQVALMIAERAVSVEPDSPWATPALMDLQAGESDWVAAGQTLERKKRHKLVDKAEGRRQEAVLLTARAMEAEDTSPESALSLALQAHKLAPNLVPAAVVAGRVLSQKGRIAKAAKILEKTWKMMPHPDIADVYAHLKLGDKPQARLKRIRFLVHKGPETLEAGLALAAAAISAQDWALARSALELYVAEPTRRVCALMAEIEDGEFGDKGRVREWLSRALRARADAVWIADGVMSQQWAAVSPVTGKLDAFEWKQPPASLPGPDGSNEDGILTADPEPDAAETEAIPAALPQPSSDEPVPAGADDKGPGAVGADGPEVIEALPAETSEEPEKAAAKEKPKGVAKKVQYADEVDVVVSQPDDPGPADEDGEKAGRAPYGLYN